MADSGVREFAPNRVSDQTPAPLPPSRTGVDSMQAPMSAPRRVAIRRARSSSISRLAAAIAAPIVTFAIALGLAIAPLAAIIISLWAIWTSLVAVARLVTLTRAGEALTSPETPALLHTLETSARVGFLTIGYLALIFALITLMGGLFGRKWGRLFILPGAAFSLTALALMGIGVLFAAPMANDLPVPAAWLIPLALYALVDAVLVSGVLVDARLTRSPSATGGHRAVRRSPRKASSTLA